MKVFALNHSDVNGGAARAAYRIHHAMRRQGVDSSMLVNQALAGDWTATDPASKVGKALRMMRIPVSQLVAGSLRTSNPILHSPAILPSRWHFRLNMSDADLLHLHWINFEMMSIADIGALRKPLVWTLHDMWAFCGAEHYTDDYRWLQGYSPTNRPLYESGLDLNRWTWQRKRRAWKAPMHIVAPSRWLGECARQSALMRDWPVTVIPNTLDTEAWQPVDKGLARHLLQLPQDVPLLLFGAIGGATDPRKGFDLLKLALELLRQQLPGLELVVFGQLAPRISVDLGFPVRYTGHLHDEVSLRLLYSATNALVIPSRQDNLPNTGLEALACGTPAVAFNAGGLPDIVEHEKTGYLAKAFDAVDLAKGLQWVLGDPGRGALLGQTGRDRAVRLWSSEVVAGQYRELYERTLKA